MNIVRRSRYLDRLIAFQDTDLIKIVTGIRRCGKSTLLDMMREHLAQQGVPAERLLTFKMESLEYAGITDYLTFYRMVRERVDGVDRPYLFFDELQNVEGWEKAVNSLRIDLPCDIYVTGSNAFLLSSELATLISGRYIEVKMQPLTFGEYLDFRSIDAVVAEGLDERAELVSKTGDRLNSNTVLEQYITYGGMRFWLMTSQDANRAATTSAASIRRLSRAISYCARRVEVAELSPSATFSSGSVRIWQTTSPIKPRSTKS